MRALRGPLLSLSLWGAFATAATGASAQQGPITYPPACDTTKVTRADVDRAHAVFLSGKQYLEESNYDKAISYFNDAYSIDCSVHGILPIIATAYERKGDKGEAIRALDEYQRRAPTAPDHEVIERRIKNLKDQMAREAPLVPLAPPAPASTAPAQPTVAQLPPTPVPAPAGAPVPGPEAPSTTAPSTARASELSPVPSPGQRSPVPWVVTGVGGAVMLAGAAVAIAGGLQIQSASSACPTRMGCAGDVVSRGNSGRTMVPVGAALAGGGALIFIGGLTWGLVSLHVRATPVIAAGYAGFALSGTL
jgi:hypothetical protein